MTSLRYALIAASLGTLFGLAGCIPGVSNSGDPDCHAKECLSTPSVTAAGLNSSLYVTWPAVSGAGSYNVYYSTAPGVVPQSIAPHLVAPLVAGPPPTTVSNKGIQSGTIIPGLSNATTYYVIATAVGAGSGVEGLPSAEVTGTPTAPGGTDTSFGGTGAVPSNLGAGGTGAGANNRAKASILDAQGRIVSVGASNDSLGNTGIAVWRYNPDGSPDTTFGGTGFVSLFGSGGGGLDPNAGPHLNLLHDEANAVTIDGQGRIVVTGFGYGALGFGYMTISRFNPDGSVDLSFNGTGYIATEGATGGGSGINTGNSVLVDSLGRILVLGLSNPGAGPWLVLWRYNDNGTPDGTFNDAVCQTGLNGALVVSGCITFTQTMGGGIWDGGAAMTLDGSGNIVIAGFSSNQINASNMTVWRLLPSGAFDSNFNPLDTPGYFTTGTQSGSGAAGGNGDNSTSIAIDPSNRIVVLGNTNAGGSNSNMVAWRLNPDGSRDTTFSDASGCLSQDASGCIMTSGIGTIALAGTVRIDAAGNIVAVGTTNSGANRQLMLWRYASDPSPIAPDSTFGGGSGVVYASSPLPGGTLVNPSNNPVGLFFDSIGRIVVTTSANDTFGGVYMTTWRFVP